MSRITGGAGSNGATTKLVPLSAPFEYTEMGVLPGPGNPPEPKKPRTSCTSPHSSYKDLSIWVGHILGFLGPACRTALAVQGV